MQENFKACFDCLVLMFLVNKGYGLCYYEKCHCPEGNERDLEEPGSELLTKLQEMRRNRNQNSHAIGHSSVTYSQGLQIFYIDIFQVVF